VCLGGAVAEGHIVDNPKLDVRSRASEDQETKHAIATRKRLAFARLLYTGVRRTAVVRLRPANIHGDVAMRPQRELERCFRHRLALLPSLAPAQALPQPTQPGPVGSCPHGYVFGSFCVPRAGAQDAIASPPNGTCPHGWTRSGSVCLRSGSGCLPVKPRIRFYHSPSGYRFAKRARLRIMNRRAGLRRMQRGERAADRECLIVQKGKPFFFLIKRSFEKIYYPTIFR